MAARSAFEDLAPTLLPDGSLSLHATTVAVDGRALVISGPSGAGKSGIAAQMLTLGAALIVDDLTRLISRDEALWAMAPTDAPIRLELRGLGLCETPAASPAPVAACLILGSSAARLPDPETMDLLGHAIPVLRHPVTFDLAAKLMLWLRGGGVDEMPQ
ncbi:MAG: hypothetical protein AAGF30_10255 [Pseudomonadota bacterium]